MRNQQRPERIVSLISSGTEILYALGLGERVVGVSHECDFPLEVARKPRLTTSSVDSSASSNKIDEQVKQRSGAGEALYEIDRAALVAMQPDLVITQAQCDVCAVRYADVLEAVDSSPELLDTQVLPLNPQSLDDVLADIQRIGRAAGVIERADAVVRGLKDRVAQIRGRTDKIAPNRRPRVACIEWTEPLMLAANWVPELIDIAGGNCPLTQAGAHSTYAEWQEVVDFNPEVIVIAACGFDLSRTMEEAKVIWNWPKIEEVSAVRGGRVWAMDGNAYLNRSGPRLVESVELLAHLFHEDIFALRSDLEGKAVQRLVG